MDIESWRKVMDIVDNTCCIQGRADFGCRWLSVHGDRKGQSKDEMERYDWLGLTSKSKVLLPTIGCLCMCVWVHNKTRPEQVL